MGQVTYPLETASADAMLEAAIEAGADDVESDDPEAELEDPAHRVTCAPDDLSAVRDALEAKFGPSSAAKLIWVPQNLIPVGDRPVAENLFKVIEALEDSDDVQTVYANFDMPDDLMAELG
jgi:transcriptional/translational regulatory protein YebC/TACO1